MAIIPLAQLIQMSLSGSFPNAFSGGTAPATGSIDPTQLAFLSLFGGGSPLPVNLGGTQQGGGLPVAGAPAGSSSVTLFDSIVRALQQQGALPASTAQQSPTPSAGVSG